MAKDPSLQKTDFTGGPKPSMEVGARPSANEQARLGVDLSPAVVRRLDQEAEWALTSNPTGAAEVAGVLLGKRGQIIEISDSEPVLIMQQRDRAYALTGPGSLEFRRKKAAFSRIGEGEHSVVGFYRSHIGEGFELTNEDRGLIRDCFGDTAPVVLLMKRTGDRPRKVRLFLGDKSSDSCELYGGEDASEETDPPHHTLRDDTRNLVQADESGFATKDATRDHPARKRRSLREIALFAAKAVGVGLLGYAILNGSAELRRRAEISRTSGREIPHGSSGPSLALHLDRRGNNLRLTWDHNAPMLIKAKLGTLTIKERSGQAREVSLDGDLLRTGSIVYGPVDHEVSFRLAVFDESRTKIGESVTASK